MASSLGRFAMLAFRMSSIRQRLVQSTIVAAIVWSSSCDTGFANRSARQLVSRAAAARNGLERAWFAQVALDPQRSRVSTWYLYADSAYAVTSSGLVTAVHAETGETLWTRHVGSSGFAAYGPGANEDYPRSSWRFEAVHLRARRRQTRLVSRPRQRA